MIVLRNSRKKGKMMDRKDEDRLKSRMDAEEAIRDYYAKCQAADYEFPSDIADVIYDATDGAVVMGEKE